MEASPSISVVMPVYNSAATLAPALESVLDQNCRDFEFIIVNDGSTDNSLQILETFSRNDQRIRIFTTENRGVGLALDHGIRQAKGRYIARMDADDICAPGRLKSQLAYLHTRENVVLCGCWSWNFCRELGVFSAVMLPDDDAVLRKLLIDEVSSTFVHSSVVFRRDAYFKTTGYRFSCAQDYDLWLQLAEQGQLGMTPVFGLLYHTNLESVTANRRSLGTEVKKLALRLYKERQGASEETTNAAQAFAELQAGMRWESKRNKQRFHRYVLGLRLAQSGRKFRALGHFIGMVGADGLGVRALWRISQLLLGKTPDTGDALGRLNMKYLFSNGTKELSWHWARDYLLRMGVTPEVYSANETYLQRMKQNQQG